MSTTSIKSPTVLAESGAGNTWQNLQNAAGTPGGSNATLLADGAAKLVDITAASLAFAIPAGASINGIKIDPFASAFEPLTFDCAVTLRKSGVDTETKSVAGNELAPQFGGPTDKWSSVWTPANINSNLSVHVLFTLSAGASAVFTFQGVVVLVYYTLNGIRGRQFRERGMR